MLTSMGFKVYGSAVADDGTVLHPSGVLLSATAAEKDVWPAISSDGTNYLVAWLDQLDLDTTGSLVAARFDATGAPLDAAPTTLGPASEFVTSASYGLGAVTGAAFDGRDYAVVSQPLFAGSYGVQTHWVDAATGALDGHASASTPTLGPLGVASDGHGLTAMVYTHLAPMAAAVVGGIHARFAVRFAPLGAGCVTATDCASGACVDGVCCDTACGGGDSSDCEACSVAAGAAVDGTCAPRTAGALCRASRGACDPAERCAGGAVACPPDAVASDDTPCDDGGVCARGTCGATAIDASVDGARDGASEDVGPDGVGVDVGADAPDARASAETGSDEASMPDAARPQYRAVGGCGCVVGRRTARPAALWLLGAALSGLRRARRRRGVSA